VERPFHRNPKSQCSARFSAVRSTISFLEEPLLTTLKAVTVTRIAAAILLLVALSSCVIGGEIQLDLIDKLVTTDVAIAPTEAPITATLEIRGVWRFGATAAYAVAEGRMELCIVRPDDDPIEYCRNAPSGQVPPGVVLLPGESLGKDVSLRLDRRNRDGAAVDTHTVQFTSNVPQVLTLLARFKSVDGDNWTFDFENRQATVTFEPVE